MGKKKQRDYSKEKEKWVVRGIIIGIIVTSLPIMIEISEKIVTFASTYIEERQVVIDSCEFSEEDHVGEQLERYNLTLKPPHNMGRIGVQAYIRISYGDEKYIVYLKDVYTSEVYTPNGKGIFSLFKRDGEEDICNVLRKTITEKQKENNIKLEKLEIESNTILCIFCENDEVRSYFVFNNGTPVYVDDTEALELLNPKTESYEYNFIWDRGKKIKDIADAIVSQF